MFRQLLDRDYVLAQTRHLRDELRRYLETGGGDLEIEGETAAAEELAALLPHLDAAVEMGESEVDLPGHSDLAYLPRNATISMIQSRLEQCVYKRMGELLPVGDGDAEVFAPAEEVAGEDLLERPLPPVTDQSIPAELFSAEDEQQELAGPFEPCDPGWLLIGVAMAWKRIRGKHALNPIPTKEALAPHARLFLFSDWATGLCRAKRLSAAIAKILGSPESRGRQCHVVHLGDTYYAGWAKEQQSHVLDVWPVRGETDDATSWALAGNHDYYSGGHGFFKRLLGDQRFVHQSGGGSPTSIFEIENAHWRVVGLDTGTEDHDLAPEQLSWLSQTLLEAKSLGQKVILLSHHQPWSAFTEDGPPPPLWQKVQPLLVSAPAAAWYWGHEHRLALYKKTTEIDRPRLIGNGGVPEYVTDPKAARDPSLVEFDFEEELTDVDGDEHWRRFAFAVVDLDEGELTESYFDEYANPIVPPRPGASAQPASP